MVGAHGRCLVPLIAALAIAGAPTVAPAAVNQGQTGFSAATVSSAAPGASGSLAADGQVGTAWYARRSGAWEWRGRLPELARLDRLSLLAARELGRVRIAVSTDGRTYRALRTVTVRRRVWTRVALGGRQAQFVAISGRSRGTRGGGLAEVRVRVLSTGARPVAASTGIAGLAPVPLLTLASPGTSDRVPEPPSEPPSQPTCRPRARMADPPLPPDELEPTGPVPDIANAPPARPVGGTPFAGVVSAPIDARQLTSVPFHTRSHWLQPWRAYLDTPPAGRLRNAVGINFNPDVADAEAVARLLAANGFRRARLEIPWGDFAYEEPSRLIHRDRFAATLCAVRDAGLRPLILLNSNDDRPVPSFGLDLTLAAPARAGDTEIVLTPDSAGRVIPRYTGVDGRFAAQALITELRPDGTATLSQPLVLPGGAPSVIGAGETLRATVLRYLPFSPPVFDDGRDNPASEETMRGWLAYVDATTRFVRDMLGTTAFDIEISNELNLNASFWDINNYGRPALFRRSLPDQAIVDRTVAWVADPGHDLAQVRVSNGFASQRPWDSGDTSPAGLDALSKHYYPRNLRFPSVLGAGSADGLRYNEPVDAVGGRTAKRAGPNGPWNDPFVPTYDTFFPEFWLTGIATETLVRDLAPWPDATVNPPTRHGRTVAAPDGRVPEIWMTEIGLDTGWATGTLGVALTQADVERIRAKATLRALMSYVHKGVRQVDLYAAATQEWGLIGDRFWRGLHANGAYPGDDAGGPVIDAVRRLVAALGDEAVTVPRRIALASVGDYGGRRQFAGNGTVAHPDLYDRDVLTFLPFQASDDRFVIGVYVMTRNLAKRYGTGSGPERFDLPAERYQLTIGGVDADRAQVSAVDPQTGAAVAVDVVRRTANGWLVVELPVTDSPRLLMLDDAGVRP